MSEIKFLTCSFSLRFLCNFWRTQGCCKAHKTAARHARYLYNCHKSLHPHICLGGRTGLVVRASDSGSEDPGSILGRVGVLFP